MRRTVTTVLRNLVEGAVLVVVLLSLFLYNVRAAFIVALTIPLSLLFAFVFMDLRGHARRISCRWGPSTSGSSSTAP